MHGDRRLAGLDLLLLCAVLQHLPDREVGVATDTRPCFLGSVKATMSSVTFGDLADNQIDATILDDHLERCRH